jgi:hypothetical protein
MYNPDLQAKLDEANQRIADLSKELRAVYFERRAQIEQIQNEKKAVLEMAENVKLSVKRARDDARNSKERAKRLKRRVDFLTAQLAAVKTC